MAQIWYVKEGSRPRNSKRGSVGTISDILKRMSMKDITFFSVSPPELETDRPDLTPFRGLTRVFVEVDDKEIDLQTIFKEPGFYKISISPEEFTKLWEQSDDRP